MSHLKIIVRYVCQIYNQSGSSATISPTIPSTKLHLYNLSGSRVVT